MYLEWDERRLGFWGEICCNMAQKLFSAVVSRKRKLLQNEAMRFQCLFPTANSSCLGLIAAAQSIHKTHFGIVHWNNMRTFLKIISSLHHFDELSFSLNIINKEWSKIHHGHISCSTVFWYEPFLMAMHHFTPRWSKWENLAVGFQRRRWEISATR